MIEPVSVVSDNGIAVIEMNMPERINALSLPMREALISTLRARFADPSCRAVVLTGAGGNFSSGGDIKSERPAPEVLASELRHRIGRLQELIRIICNSNKPVVAAVDGKAYGAGMSLAMACDVVVATESCSFCAAFGKVGLIADAGLLFTLPQRIGAARSRRLLLTARVVESAEALSLGLVDRVVAQAGLREAAIAEALHFGATAPLAFAAMKSLTHAGSGSLEDAFAEELRLQPLLAMSLDNAEARAAFAEKRKPVFRGQ